MQPDTRLKAWLVQCPLIAILRGVKPDEVEGIAEVLIAEGIGMIEVPLNSPDPFASLERLVRRFGNDVLIGAGTVLSLADLVRVAEVGGQVVISPNVNVGVINETVRRGLISIPGYFTASEAFSAIDAGASALKLFPAEAASPTILNAQRAVIPRTTPILAVGGITPQAMAQWKGAADGFGLGSALYKTGMKAVDVSRNAKAFVTELANFR